MNKIQMPSHKSMLFAAAAIAVAGTSSLAHAQENWKMDKTYVRVQGGLHAADDNGYDTSGGRVSAKYDDDPIYGVAVGAQSGHMRYEVEGLRAESGVKGMNIAGVQGTSPNGTTDLNALMVNVYYDFGEARLKPYIGGGAGVGRVKVDGHSNAGLVYADDDDTVFAYQGMAGVKYDVTPNWSVNAEYRYIGTNDAEISTLGGTETSMAYDSNNVLVGVSYNF